MGNRRSHFNEFRERRAAVRHMTSLRVELWPESSPRGPHPFLFTTTDVSTQGFYFLSAQLFHVGSRLKFRLVFPRELTGGFAELRSGLARCIRVENILGHGLSHFGIGMKVERVNVKKRRNS
jgi:hypothetical protein